MTRILPTWENKGNNSWFYFSVSRWEEKLIFPKIIIMSIGKGLVQGQHIKGHNARKLVICLLSTTQTLWNTTRRSTSQWFIYWQESTIFFSMTKCTICHSDWLLVPGRDSCLKPWRKRFHSYELKSDLA